MHWSRPAPTVAAVLASLAVIVAVLPAGSAPVWGATALALVALGWVQRRPTIPMKTPTSIRIGAVAVPIVLLFALYWRVTQAWWLGDDPAILWAVVNNGVVRHFWSPNVWRQFSSNNLTPWEILSYGVDWHLFGLDPAGYYWHQLASLAAVVGLGFVVLCRFVKPATASLSLCLFVASGPVASVSQQLMTRHYIEGLGLALAAVALFSRAVEKRSSALAWLAGAAYLASCSAKEVFVPLVLVLPFLPVGDARARIRMLRPQLLALAAYIPWRVWMLGPSNVLAGYGTLFSGSHGMWPQRAAVRFAGAMGWNRAGVLSVALVVVCMLVVLAVRKAPAGLLVAGSVTAVTVGPLLPVVDALDPRMLLVASFVLAVALGIAVGLLAPGPGDQAGAAAMSMALLAVGVAAVAKNPMWLDRSPIERYRVEGTAVLTGPEDLPVLGPVGPPWFYTCLGRLRTRLYKSSGPTVCYDVCACSAAGRYRTGLRFAAGGLSEAPLDTSGCRFRAAPLTVEFTYEMRADTLRWTLGPYRDGKWYYMDDLGFAQAVPPQGFYPIRLGAATVFKIRYVSPDGWSAQSPQLQLDRSSAGPDGVVRLSWSGRGPSGAPPPPGT